jgi:hypothetical protein
VVAKTVHDEHADFIFGFLGIMGRRNATSQYHYGQAKPKITDHAATLEE